jgi:hypothetical protein
MLLPQVFQRLDDEHSLLLALYMLNSAELMTELGFSARVLEEGFNTKNNYERTAPFHGESLKRILLSTKEEKLPSKKFVRVVFRILMGTIAYNLFNLFLNSEKCSTLEDYTLKTHRQRRRSEERNPDIIIYKFRLNDSFKL